MKLESRLIPVGAVSQPRGVVLVLHGGASRRRNVAVSAAQLSVVRMIPIARTIARAGEGGLAVFGLLNSRRGWDSTHTPVQDVRWALEQIPQILRQTLPVCLVGHSLGGRAALLAAGEPSVAGAVALAPWVLSRDDPRDVEGKPLLIVHGSDDRVVSPARAAALAARLEHRAPPYRLTVVRDAPNVTPRRSPAGPRGSRPGRSPIPQRDPGGPPDPTSDASDRVCS